MSVHWPIIRRLLASPLAVAVIDDRRSYRGIEILVAAMNLAAHLQSKCQSPTLGVMLPTGGGFPIVALAGWFLGKTVVPLNYLLKQEELQYVIDDCGTDTVVTAGPMLEFTGFTPRARNLVRIEQLSLAGVPEFIRPALADDQDLAVLLYTSGTSGRPKGVMLTHANLAANIQQVDQWVHFTRRDVMMGVLPQFHSFGMTVLTLLPLTLGMKVVYAPRFVPQRIVKLCREHRPSILVAIPSMYTALLSVKDAVPEDFASLRYAISGGEPLPDSTFERFHERFKVRLAEGYGLTETAPATNWCRPDHWRRHSVGPPLPGVIERVVDINSREVLGPDEEGEVLIKGPNVMRGYYHLPDQTAAAFDEHGYFRTGDIGRFDPDGHLFITGRLKEMLIIGGENVFPREIEEVLNQHPSVTASGVIGRQDPMRGELPIAFVELKEDAVFDEKELQRWCRQKLAGYKVPDEIRRLDQLPRNPTGKIMRRELKKLLDS
ncbi:MAG: AMP-binding protein [Phycisphaerae bacterium]|nr:AMP-binding protein [Phycisphaerae bacterium]